MATEALIQSLTDRVRASLGDAMAEKLRVTKAELDDANRAIKDLGRQLADERALRSTAEEARDKAHAGLIAALNRTDDSIPLMLNSALSRIDGVALKVSDIGKAIADNTQLPTPPTVNPKREIKDSGLLKAITSSTLPDNFGMKIYETQQSYQVFALTGVTKDSTGAALGSCRVIAFESDRISSDLVEASIRETISDGSGNYSIPARRIAYQLTAYKPGSPDVAGITRNDVVPSLI